METLPCAKAARNQREPDMNESCIRELRQVVQEYIDDRRALLDKLRRNLN
jgi:hypothetical protein